MIENVEIKFRDKIYNINIRDEADRSVMAEIFKCREYRAVEKDIAAARFPVLDVGAHAGFFILYARALNSKIKIFALEPENNNLSVLNENLEKNQIKNVRVLPLALAGASGERNLSISLNTHNHRLLPIGGAVQVGNSARTRAVSFADFCIKNKIKKLSLIKMDIEGGEYEVISSLLLSDYGRIGCIIMEYHDFDGFKHDEIENKLRENGFGVQIFPSKFDKKMGFLLARNKRI